MPTSETYQKQWEGCVNACKTIYDFYNKRIRIFEPNIVDAQKFGNQIEIEMKKNEMGKCLMYVYKSMVEILLADNRFRFEGIFEGFFNGRNGYTITFYADQERSKSRAWKEAEEIVSLSNEKAKNPKKLPPLPSHFTMRKATLNDAEKLSAFLTRIFPVYASPIDDINYVRTFLKDENYPFYVIETNNNTGEKQPKIVCACAADIDVVQRCAEISDCATDSDFRGQNLLTYLIIELEKLLLNERKIPFLFSLTRATIPAMNITIAQQGYKFTGRLVNNCKMGDGLEDMNIWCKPMSSIHD